MVADKELVITERQLQVVQLMARGHSHNEIAALMGVTPRTVKAHIEAVRAKLGRPPRRELPRILHEHGYDVYPR